MVGKNMKWVRKMGEIYKKCEECKDNMRRYRECENDTKMWEEY